MSENWIEFHSKTTGNKLSAISVEGATMEEVKATIELLAFENNIKETDIEVKIN